MQHVLPLEQCTEDLADLVGGKALGLGSLLREGFQVPTGFCVPANVYSDTLVATGLDREIVEIVESGAVKTLDEASARIRELFENEPLPAEVAADVTAAYEQLPESGQTPVAVRSSARGEDSADASFAGQQESYLWIRGSSEVHRHIMRCWGSLFTPQAISYRADRRIRLEDVAMCVVVQQMVPAEAAGVMFTLDPLTGDPSQICIEASYGLGTAVVGGEVTPDRFVVDKVTLELRDQETHAKPFAHRFDPDTGSVRSFDIPDTLQAEPCLSTEEVIEIARLGKTIERTFGAPQDIEIAVAGAATPRDVYLLQTRPETVWSKRKAERKSLVEPGTSVLDRMLVTMRKPMKIVED